MKRWCGHPEGPGSSPRGRGKLTICVPRRTVTRLTPAWAGKTPQLHLQPARCAAHPRVGGENCFLCGNEGGCVGSSPRGRGKHAQHVAALVHVRLIPAWAGKTPYSRGYAASAPAHPRVGGENPTVARPEPREAGSSPRGRGKRGEALPQRLDHGLIPAWAGKTRAVPLVETIHKAHPRVGEENHHARACRRGGRRLIPAWAGKTVRRSRARRPCRAHPRVGGENIEGLVSQISDLGSSPRGRGKRTAHLPRMRACRLIPAWAGKTRSRVRGRMSWWAHPRVGGENCVGGCPAAAAAGSSPRGRGKRRPIPHQRNRHGLIPAWAGKTWHHGSCPCTRRAHPRVGGENRVLGGGDQGRAGSSPRGRGKRRCGPAPARGARLIPAWAGKTACPTDPSMTWAAHPRVGGENQTSYATLRDYRGSSPRGRGKLPGHAHDRALVGLIPAWAGKTFTFGIGSQVIRAHPRVGGENDRHCLHAPPDAGSSPRGRGKLRTQDRRTDHVRLIPAWAGKTRCRRRSGRRGPAHPRVGGENAWGQPWDGPGGGSSPRRRGKPYGTPVRASSRGLIPA